MSVRLRDRGVLLEPVTSVDSYTGEQTPDWSQPATEHPVRLKVEPVSSQEQVLTAGTVVSRWTAYLPPQWVDSLASWWRVRWAGADYEVDGAVEQWRTAGRARFLVVTLKRVQQ